MKNEVVTDVVSLVKRKIKQLLFQLIERQWKVNISEMAFVDQALVLKENKLKSP